MTGHRVPMELREYEVPNPEPGAVLLKMKLAGLCGSDLHWWRGDQANNPLPPTGRPMGHEGVGVVHALGEGVTTDFLGNTIKEGDRIVFSAVYSCGRCIQCLNGDHNFCSQFRLTYRSAADQHPFFVNTYSDYTYLPPNHPIFKVPDELSDEEVVSLNCAMGTVYQGMRVAGMRPGQTVVIQGAGGLGQYAAVFAKEMGAARIIAVDGQPARLNLARELGATDVIDIHEMETPQARASHVMNLTNRRGADLVIELVGFGELVPEGLSMLGNEGTFLEIGNLMRGRTATIDPMTMLRRKKIIGSAMYRPAYLAEIMDILVRVHKSVPLRKVISHKFPLAQINDAFQQSEWSGKTTDVIRGAIVP
jgi:D-arabinose 1-dehydrogenase-like Zn-dependent alcohol dehydrogenase